MMQGLYAATTGMKTHSSGLGIISQNLSNVSTVAYKQQSMLFENLMSKEMTMDNPNLGFSQVGYGSSLSSVRTLFTDGSFEPSGNMTDIAITGKGFFQVSDGQNSYYTRAGNFGFDKDGILRSPTGMSVTGIKVNNGVDEGGLSEIRINIDDDKVMRSEAKPTTKLSAYFNVFDEEDSVKGTEDPANPGTYMDPYFALANAWNGKTKPNLPQGTKNLDIPFYDSNGKPQHATVHFDSAPGGSGGSKVLEYIVTIPPELDGSSAAGTEDAGLLMAGTLTFSSAGELINMSAFTAPEGDKSDLSKWTLANLQDGSPQVKIPFKGQPEQLLSLNFGVQGNSGWSNNVTAAGIGSNLSAIPGMVDPTYDSKRSSAVDGSTALKGHSQDGYGAGEYTGMYINAEGEINVRYSNGQEGTIYRIPIFRFASEDGLRREGNNMYSHTDAAGEMEYGTAGTENYGSVLGSHLETSNVNTAAEMVNMIIIQRGFQSNSKAFETTNKMIEQALEIKRA